MAFAKTTGHHHVTGHAGYFNLSGYRRWGFESVRKGYHSANARLRSFEKESSFCKLTVASGIWKELLHVSLGAVQKCCRSGFIKGFSFFHCLAWIEKAAFSAKLKTFLFSENLPKRPQKQHFFANQTLFIYTSPSLSLSKATLFHLKHRKFAPSHNLLFAKNTAVLLMSAQNPYAVTPKRRTDSKPFRCRFVRKTGFGSCRRKFIQKYFRQSFESRSQDGVPRAFWLLFARRKK